MILLAGASIDLRRIALKENSIQLQDQLRLSCDWPSDEDYCRASRIIPRERLKFVVHTKPGTDTARDLDVPRHHTRQISEPGLDSIKANRRGFHPSRLFLLLHLPVN